MSSQGAALEVKKHWLYQILSTSQQLKSWIAFAQMHKFPLEPTSDTLSFFIVYMSHHIRPDSVKSYLSGLVQQLDPDFPSIREIRANRLVKKVMKGCMKTRGQPARRKLPLTIEQLCLVKNKFQASKTHNDLL